MNLLTIQKKTIQSSKKNLFAGKITPFNPIDANTIALWDGDINLETTEWLDRISDYNISLFNAPTVNATGLNGHGTVIFDGISQYGICPDPPHPISNTIYLVLSQITSTNGNYIFSFEDAVCYILDLLQTSGNGLNIKTPVSSYAVTNTVINSFQVYTIVQDLTGINSGIRINLTPIQLNNYGAVTTQGLTLGINSCGDSLGNVSFAYIIIRNVVDNTATQNKYINYLKHRFAI